MDLETIRYKLDTGRDVPPVTDAALEIVNCLGEIHRRLSALETNNPTDSYRAAVKYADRISGDVTPDILGEIEKAFLAGVQWMRRERNPAAYDAARNAIVADEPCPCAMCDRSPEFHADYRAGLNAGLVGADDDVCPFGDVTPRWRVWHEGWKAGRAEYDRLNPDESEARDGEA